MEDARPADAGGVADPQRPRAVGMAEVGRNVASPCISTVVVTSDGEASDCESGGGDATTGIDPDGEPARTSSRAHGPDSSAPPGERGDKPPLGGSLTPGDVGGEEDARGDDEAAKTSGTSPEPPLKRPRDEEGGRGLPPRAGGAGSPPAKRRPAGIPAGVVLTSAPTASGAGGGCEGAAPDPPTEGSDSAFAVTWDTLRSFYDVGEAWRPIIEPELSNANVQATFSEYERRLRHETVFPAKTSIFAWTRYAAPEDVRVVIVGQDPYHGPGQANGLAFSVKASAPVPPSLQNIYAAVARDYPSLPPPAHGSLTAWAKQGVLLLNTSLTVRRGCPGSHAGLGWGRLVRAVLRRLDATVDHMVFMLWGAHAQKAYSPERPKAHLVLTHSHPSPLARTPFVDCGHFARANAYLTAHGRPPVDWRVE
nr:uracil-DNA glycosylase [Monodontid alphaherpesvirus 2]